MRNSTKSLIRAIVDKFHEAPSLVAPITGDIYFTEVPQETIMPFVVFYLIGGSGPTTTFQRGLDITHAAVQFSIFDLTSDPVTILGYADYLKERFDWASFIYAEETQKKITCTRRSEGILTKSPDGDRPWQYIVDYEVSAQDTGT